MFQTLCAGMENKNREEGGDKDVFFPRGKCRNTSKYGGFLHLTSTIIIKGSTKN